MATTYLTRTFSSPTNRKIWTWSAWVKRQNLVSDYANAMFGAYYDANNRSVIRFYEHELNFQDSANSVEIKTNRLFRDLSAWYHIVARVDTTQGTASDRIRLYVNGEQQTSFKQADYPAQNDNMQFNGADPHYINARKSSGSVDSIADMSYSHIHFADGQSLAPTVFGETDTTTGEWKIKTNPSFTLGNNGFTILKDGNTITDQSTNSNNFTVGAGTLTKTEDCPSNVFPTINPLTNSTTKWNLEYGNLRTNGHASGVGNAWRSVYGTLGASSGKYYFEMKVTSTNSGDPNNFIIGIVDAEQMKYEGDNGKFVETSRAYGYRAQTGNKVNNSANAGSSYGNTFTTNDIIGCAFDLDNHKLYFSKNGTWQNSGDPTSGSTGTGSAFDLATGYTYLPVVAHYYNDDRIEFNFGNGYFGITAVSSAGTNASNNGIFEYDVPTGYTALSTKGLNL